jgi:hypothetical protein
MLDFQKYKFYPCPKPNGCPLNNDVEECGTNYKNGSILCAVCAWKSHAVRTNDSEYKCVKCGDDVSSTARRDLILVVMSLVVVYAIVIALYLHIETCSKIIDKAEEAVEALENEEEDQITISAKKLVRKKIKRARTLARSIVTRIKILVSFVQCLAALSNVYTINWPVNFAAMLDILNVINFDILSLTNTDCAFEQNFFDSLMLTLSLPISAVILLYYIYVHAFACKVSRSRAKFLFKNDQRRALTDRALRIFFWILLVSFPAASTKAMQHFKCIQLDENIKWLDADYRIRCGSASHFTHMLPAILGIICYPIGIPLLLLILVCQQRTNLDHPLIEERLGFLYSSYKPTYFYWEIVEIVRKLLLTSCIIFVGDGTASQVLVGLLVSIICLSMHLRLHPFAESTGE